MSFRDPLIVLRPYPASTTDAAVAQAVAIAAALALRASAIACGFAPRIPRSILGNALVNISGMVAEEKQKSAADAQRLLAKFAEEVGRKGISLGDKIFEIRQSAEAPSVLLDYARLYDLMILPMPEGDYISQFDAQWYAETIVFGSGHPTIILPQTSNATGPVVLDRIMVAWDKSQTAARAITDAMPILRAAKNIHLLTVIGEKAIASERSSVEFARHLALQDVKVVVDEVNAEGRSIGEILTQQAKIYASDLIVMGAYGRSRIREFILGGATKAMLTHPPAALFVSH